ATAQGRPGGGLGPPIDPPHPLQKYTWVILGVFAVALIAGAMITAMRAPTAATNPLAGVKDGVSTSKPQAGPSLLDALKEEMFQLEVEHKRGQISQQDYEKAKAALDYTLQRATTRNETKA